MSGQPLIDAIRAHASRVFPGRALETLRWDEGGVVRNLADFAVVRVAPAAGGASDLWIHLSAGASAAPMEDGYGLEFVLLTRAPEKLAAKLLAMVANLHADIWRTRQPFVQFGHDLPCAGRSVGTLAGDGEPHQTGDLVLCNGRALDDAGRKS